MAGRKKEFNFKLGEKVTAKWPGSNMYYSGIVTKLRRDNQYEIKFGDESFHTVHPRNVHTPSPSPEREDPSKKSSSSTTTKIKKRTASKSPTRKSISKSKSPTRKSLSKSKSPSRKRKSSKSPARSGPPRAAKSPSRSYLQTQTRRARSRSKTPGDSVETVKTVKKEKTTPPLTRKSNSIPRKIPSRSTHRITSKSIQQPINPSYEKLQRMGFEMEWIPSEEETEASPREDDISAGFQNFAISFLIVIAVILLPVFVFWINLSCDRLECALSINKFPVNTDEYLDAQSMLLYITWILFQMILAILPLGHRGEGQPLIDGSRLRYRLNGLHSFVITMAILCGLIYTKTSFDLIFDEWLQLITASAVVSYFTCFYLMIRARKLLLKDMTRGIPNTNAAGFFLGRELNPRIGELDLKFFALIRPSMMGWAVLDVLILYQEYETSEAFYPSIWFVGISQLVYILDGFIFEEAFLTGWDITKEGCGFIIIFGGFCFAPFIFTITLRYLLLHHPTIDIYFLTAIITINIVAYSIYRVANNQKDEFRRNPYHQKFITAKTIETRTARKILVDGWWKHLRHPNYFGDLMIALTWSLPCGFDSVIPYTYFFYLFVLLIHRAYRDDKVCLKKYGDAWVSYCKHVPYRVIPYCY